MIGSFVPWPVMDTFDDINDKWEFFLSSLLSILDSFAPQKSVPSSSSKRSTPWITPDILATIKNKHCAKQRAAKSHNPQDIALL